MDTNVQEVWKEIKGYEGLYEISNTGRVKSLRSGKDLVVSYAPYGYLRLSKGRAETFRIHSLVGRHFLENPNNLKEINHKDGNKQNNHVDNLEYVSHRRNIQHAWETGLMANVLAAALKNSGRKHPCITKWLLTTPEGEEVTLYGAAEIATYFNKTIHIAETYTKGRVKVPSGYNLKRLN